MVSCLFMEGKALDRKFTFAPAFLAIALTPTRFGGGQKCAIRAMS